MLKVKDLTKKYEDLTAVRGVSFTVKKQEVFGFLGPNGAGKTTTLEMIEGLRHPNGGEIFIKDISVWPNPAKTKKLIGVQLQSTSFYEELTVKETMNLYAALYDQASGKNVDKLIEIARLSEKANTHVNALSGGQQQRLAIITTLVNEPEIIFLDEPTTGLDPQARRRIWEIIKDLQNKGKTVVLTTHYMEEAEFLCDRVAVMDEGKIVAIDTPQALINNLGKTTRILFTSDKPITKDALKKAGFAGDEIKGNNGQVEQVLSENPQKTISILFSLAEQQNMQIKDLQVSTPTLEDVFLDLTGKELRD